jgi:hypothetical protein
MNQSKYEPLAQKVAKIEAKLQSRQTMEAKLLKYATDNTKYLEVLQAQEKRFEYLGSRLQALITKECILTEVTRYAQQTGSADIIVRYHFQLMKAFNWGDEFWQQKYASQMTIREWFDKIMTVADPKTSNIGTLSIDEIMNKDKPEDEYQLSPELEDELQVQQDELIL